MGYAISCLGEGRSASEVSRVKPVSSIGMSSRFQATARSSTSLSLVRDDKDDCSRLQPLSASSPGITPKPAGSPSRRGQGSPALSNPDRLKTAYTAEVIPFPGGSFDDRPRKPGGGGGGGGARVESSPRPRRYGSYICALVLVSLILSCKYWVPFVMSAGPVLGPFLVTLIVLVIVTARNDLPFGSGFLLNCSILLIVVGGFYLPLMVAPAILGSVVATLGLALR